MFAPNLDIEQLYHSGKSHSHLENWCFGHQLPCEHWLAQSLVFPTMLLLPCWKWCWIYLCLSSCCFFLPVKDVNISIFTYCWLYIFPVGFGAASVIYLSKKSLESQRGSCLERRFVFVGKGKAEPCWTFWRLISITKGSWENLRCLFNLCPKRDYIREETTPGEEASVPLGRDVNFVTQMCIWNNSGDSREARSILYNRTEF